MLIFAVNCLDDKPKTVDGVTFNVGCWLEEHIFECGGTQENSKCKRLRKRKCIHLRDEQKSVGSTTTITKHFSCPDELISPAR